MHMAFNFFIPQYKTALSTLESKQEASENQRYTYENSSLKICYSFAKSQDFMDAYII